MSCAAVSHCWHELEVPSGFGPHEVKVSIREVCCFCGDERSVKIFLGAVDGHGPHKPHTAKRLSELQAEILKLKRLLSVNKKRREEAQEALDAAHQNSDIDNRVG